MKPRSELPDRVLETGRAITELDPSSYLGHWVSSVGLEQGGDMIRAVAAMRKANDLSGGMPFTRGFLAWILGEAGAAREARRMVDEMTRASASRYYPPSAIALGHIGLDDWDDAFAWLERAVEQSDPLAMPIKSYPFLDPVRDDDRYHHLLEKMKLA